MSGHAPHRRFRFAVLLLAVAGCVLMVIVIRHAIGPRRYMEWRSAIRHGQITEDELRREVGEDEYKDYREFFGDQN